MFLFVPFLFQQCTDESSEIDALIRSNSEYSSETSGTREIPLNSYKAIYFNSHGNSTDVTERIEKNIEQEFNQISNTFNDATSAFWVGDFDFNSGNYEISVEADKEVTMLIGNKYVFNENGLSANRIRSKNFRSLGGLQRVLIFYNMDKSQIAEKILEYYTGLNSAESTSEDAESSKTTIISPNSNDQNSTSENLVPHLFVKWTKRP